MSGMTPGWIIVAIFAAVAFLILDAAWKNDMERRMRGLADTLADMNKILRELTDRNGMLPPELYVCLHADHEHAGGVCKTCGNQTLWASP